ncbi:MAG: orotidine-5'-phosphate decarboxylase [Pseudanabaenaceae cyanobacterium]
MIGDRIIVALDVPDLESALTLCDRLPAVTHYKVGLELFISCGQEILWALRARGKEIFLDLKLHDIPNTVARACQIAMRYEVKFLTVHALGGQDMLSAAQSAVADSNTQLLAVTVLTNLTAEQLQTALKITLPLSEYVLHLASLSQQAGIAGVVCSPHEIAPLRAKFGQAMGIVCPGVRPPWAVVGDQQRIMTPKEAIAAGADYLVIGRPITQHPDPPEAWQKILQELTTG